MADEEKVKEYARRISKPCLHITCNQYCSMVKQAFLDGLAEGRKEVTYMTAEEYDRTLDKCKECYLSMVEKFSKRNEDLEKTVEELQLNLRSRNDLVEELTMQIEKMKCCQNCKHDFENGEYCCNPLCTHFEEWELAE